MIQLEVDGFLITVPIRDEMPVAEFLAIADKVAAMSNREQRASMPTAASATAPMAAQPLMLSRPIFRRPSTEDEFRLPEEMRPDHLAENVRRHMEHLKAHEQRIAQQEEHTRKILEYLQSLDRYIRR